MQGVAGPAGLGLNSFVRGRSLHSHVAGQVCVLVVFASETCTCWSSWSQRWNGASVAVVVVVAVVMAEVVVVAAAVVVGSSGERSSRERPNRSPPPCARSLASAPAGRFFAADSRADVPAGRRVAARNPAQRTVKHACGGCEGVGVCACMCRDGPQVVCWVCACVQVWVCMYVRACAATGRRCV